MALPTQTEMNGIVLVHVADGGIRQRKVIRDEVEESLGLTAEERAQTTSSGVRTVQSRAGWSISNLSELGLMECVSHGTWRISDQGRALVERCGGDLAAVTERCRVLLNERNAQKAKKGPATPDAAAAATGAAKAGCAVEGSFPAVGDLGRGGHVDKSPQEVIEDAMEELDDALAAELLDAILANEPRFFERLVVDVLTKMGYGAGQTTSYVHDGGIDGIIDMDALGLDQIYVQAKRYEPGNTVGRPTLQSFAGAMNKVSRGVFITTSTFSHDAIEYAKSYSNATIVLVDGQKLARLMIRYGVGVNVEHTYEVKRLDSDYFA